MGLLRDPRKPEKQSASRTFLAITLLAIFTFIAADAFTPGVEACTDLEHGCGTPWAFSVGTQAYALLGTITTMLSVWAGFGTTSRTPQ